MEREIKFRGKSKKTGKWIEGYYVYNEYQSFIHTLDTNEEIEVDEETVGQFTGKDEIYEGDVIVADFRTKSGIKKVKGLVIFDEYMFSIDDIIDPTGEGYSINRLSNIENLGQNADLDWA